MGRLNRLYGVVLAGCMLSLCIAVAAAEPAVDGLSRTRWAETLPGGPMRVVFLAPYGAQHDSFELMQRFDIDGTVLTMASLATKGYIDRGFHVVGHYWPDLLPREEEVLRNIREALSTEWEAVVMSWLPAWSKYPDDIRQSILEKIASGCGLVIGGLDDVLIRDVEAMGLELEETGIGTDRFPFSDSDKGTARIYRCGEGYVVHFNVQSYPADGYLLSDSPRQSDFEFSAARAGWFLHRAGRSAAPSYLLSTRFAGSDLVVEAGARPELSGARLQVVVHRCDTYKKVLDASRKLKPGKSVTVALPQLPGGEYQAEVRVTNRDGVTLDWDALRFTVNGRVSLKAFTTEKQEVRSGEKVNCHLNVEGNTAGLETVARWYDNWDRLLLETAPRPFSEKMVVTGPAGSLSVINRLEVTVSSDRGPEAIGSVELLMPQNVRPTDFHMLYWKLDTQKYSSDSWRRRLQWDVLRREGAADGWANCQPYVNEARDAALSHLRTVPYTTSFHAIPLAELLDEEAVARTEEYAREAARAFRPYNPLAYTLGDENYMSWKTSERFADTPRSWVKFREYLRTVYPDLRSLNTQWETNFAAWDEIRFASEGEMLPSMDNPSAWVDYRMFVTRHFTDAHRRMRRAIREEHPDAWVGWDGAEQASSYGAIDWWEFCQDMELVQTYHTQLVPDTPYPWKIFNGEAIGSFGRDAPLSGCFMNRADREYGGEFVPWYLLLNGWNSTWWWQATYLHPANGPLRWDLGLTPIAEPMAEAVKEIKRGPGTLLAHARKVVSPIAIHYSANNWHASTIESGVGNHVGNLGIGVAFLTAPKLAGRIYEDDEMAPVWGAITPNGHYAVASANFYTLLHDIGFEPRTMARQEIEAGALRTSGTRVLILPFTVALSDVEVEKIREFVAGGGVLIADYRCGLRDGHGRLREKPALDDVFGIKRESLGVRRGRAKVVVDVGGGAQFETLFHDPVASDGAEVRAYHDDGTPAFFAHHYSGGSNDAFGWYRLRLKTPAAFAGKKLYLVFEALDEDAYIYVNGTKVFEHSCASTGLVPDVIWKTPFACDVSDFLRPGEEDLLAVGVYNRVGMGGIYEPAYLVGVDSELDLQTLQERARRGADAVLLSSWRFALDEGKHGMDEKWYATDFNDAAWVPMRTDLHTGWQGQGFSGGQTIYLNADLYNYLDMRRHSQERQIRELFAELIANVSQGSANRLLPPFQVKHQYGSTAGRMEVTQLRDGDTWYYGVLPAFAVDDKAPRPVILPFAEGRHIYDVRAHKYIGNGGPIEDTLYPGQPKMYAVLPYPVDGLTVRAPREVRRGELVKINIAVAAHTEEMGPHAVRVEVSLPDGRQAEYLARTLYLRAGKGTFSFVPALNSPNGRWHVSAVEAVSGAGASADFDVR